LRAVYRRFLFEGDIYKSLDCVPLSVRRKLDLAELKISLEGWQALSHAERLSLCHLPVDGDDAIAVYREIMNAFCARASVALKKLDDPNATSRAWNQRHVPEPVKSRTSSLGVELDDNRWSAFDEEVRYALLKLADPKRNPLKLEALLVELGLRAGPPPIIQTKVVVCEPGTAS
jgi:hypothetical protein